MSIRDVGRFFSMGLAVGFAGLAVAACGTRNSSTFADAGPDASTMAFPIPDGSSFQSGDGGAGPFGSLGDASFTSSTCTPKSCADQGYNCGKNGDSCGNIIDCGSCSGADFCGGGGYSICGTMGNAAPDGGALSDAGNVACTPKTCEQLNANCGWVSDSCSDVILCGSLPDGGAVTLAHGADGGVSDAGVMACPTPTICGGANGSTPNQCSGDTTMLTDGGVNNVQCTPKGCPAGANCGKAGDGCGNQITCGGDCTNPQFCGGGGPNTCGGDNGLLPDGGPEPPPPCAPTTCQALGYNCGQTGDGCGNPLDCSGGTACPPPTFCGGPNGSTPNVCSGGLAPDGGPLSDCTPDPNVCTKNGFECGQADDGCGNPVSCGTCTAPNTCGGDGVAGKCGTTCVGLCTAQAACDGGTPTTITGTVKAAVSSWLQSNGVTSTPDPVPNVLVYIPNAPLTAIAQGYAAGQCPLCGADVSGSPLVSTYTNFDGTFTLTNVPTPSSGQVPVVIQLGRWRKEVMISPPAACKSTNIGTINLPQNQTDGNITQSNGASSTNIPLTAISTGNVDALECVLLKMGVDPGEFTADTGTGRIHIYNGGAENNNGQPGATVSGARQEPTLMNGSNGKYMGYDQMMFPCWGGPVTKPSDELQSLVTYADSGGHFFATHFSWSWLAGNGEFNNVAQWATTRTTPQSATATLNVSTTPPVAPAPMYSGIFYKWLNLVGALSNSSGNPNSPPNNPQVNIGQWRHDANAVANGSLDWIDGTDPEKNNQLVEHFTFNTPVGASTQCGHGIFSDFHVVGGAGNSQLSTNGQQFPGECPKQAMTAQERVLEYMIFDLASCVVPPTQVTCTPKTCDAQGLHCGDTGDGCGNPLHCGTCTPPQTCGGGGQPGVCGQPDAGTCAPSNDCTNKCGVQGDGCGGTFTCPCPAGTTCGGGGVPNQCGARDAGTCVPGDCTAAGISCGPAGDGCGNTIDCGRCAVGETCGGAGVRGVCAPPDAGIACVPLSCTAQNISCGPAGDGCGGLQDCGKCPDGQTCGGGGVPGQCGGNLCLPLTCAALGLNCGPAGDGCGNILQCGTCTGGQTCGGGGQPGVCGSMGPR